MFNLIKYYLKTILNIYVNQVYWLIDSVYEIGESYCPQVFLEECRYVVKQVKTCITDLLMK